jgi:hypothetical protein
VMKQLRGFRVMMVTRGRAGRVSNNHDRYHLNWESSRPSRTRPHFSEAFALTAIALIGIARAAIASPGCRAASAESPEAAFAIHWISQSTQRRCLTPHSRARRKTRLGTKSG